MPGESQTIDNVINTFRSEFAPIVGKFVVSVLDKDEWNAKRDYIWHSGVYVGMINSVRG